MTVMIVGAVGALAAGCSLGLTDLRRRVSALESRAATVVDVPWKRASGYVGGPLQATPGAAGLDLKAAAGPTRVVPPGGRLLVPTGMILELPFGVEAQVRPRSGHALRDGVTVLNSPGTIDSDYRGEVQVLLVNLGHEPFRIEPGDRIAQLVLARVLGARLCEVDQLQSTTRSSGGFGSTGVT
jgi:dUTP pyrophosphatase